MRWSVPFIQRIGPPSSSPCSRLELVDPRDERLGVVGQRARRCRSPGRGTRPAPWSRRAPTHQNAAAVDRRGHAPPHDGVLEPELARAAAASGRRGRTCRAGSRPPWRRRSAAARSRPSCRLRTIVSPDTRNSSMRMYQGPIAQAPRRGQPAQRRPRPRAGSRGSRRPPPSGRRAGSGRTTGRPRARGAGRRAGRRAAAGTSGTAGTTPGPSGCAGRCRLCVSRLTYPVADYRHLSSLPVSLSQSSARSPRDSSTMLRTRSSSFGMTCA